MRYEVRILKIQSEYRVSHVCHLSLQSSECGCIFGAFVNSNLNHIRSISHRAHSASDDDFFSFYILSGSHHRLIYIRIVNKYLINEVKTNLE